MPVGRPEGGQPGGMLAAFRSQGDVAGIRVILEVPPERFEVPPGVTTIGRSRTCGVRLNDPSVSRNHALLSVAGSRVTLQDLESSNGTFLNGERVERETELVHGDSVAFGEPTALVLIETAAQADTRPDGQEMPPTEALSPVVPPTIRLAPSSSEAIAVGDVLPIGEVLARSPLAWEKTGILDLGPSAPPSEPAAAPPPSQAKPAFEPRPLAWPNEPLGEAAPAGREAAGSELLPSLADLERQLALRPDDTRETERSAQPRDAAPLPPASFVARALAFTIDGLLVAAAALAAQIVLGSFAGLVTAIALSLLIPLAGWARRGGSPGKRMIGLAVCDVTSGRQGISVGQALLRWSGYLASGMTLGLGHLLALVRRDRRALQDLLAGTYVGRRT